MRTITLTEATREAAMSADEAREHALSLGARKFRLEGSRAGNSRFLYRATAARMQLRYGGEIVNYRPRLPSPLIAEARGLPPCEVCRVPAGFTCRTPRGRRRKPHKARLS